MMIVCTHGACDCPGYPGQSAQSNGLCPPTWLLVKTLYTANMIIIIIIIMYNSYIAHITSIYFSLYALFIYIFNY